MNYTTPEQKVNSTSPKEKVENQYRDVIEKMIPDALMVVQDLLCDDRHKPADRIRAAQLVGKWYGLEERDKGTSDNEVDLKDYLNSLKN